LANDSKNIGSIVERYSKALLELAIENKSLDMIHNDVVKIIDILESSNEFNRVIKSPIISRDDQSLVINSILNKISASETVIKFFAVVSSNRRSFIIDRICYRFLEMEVKHKGEIRAELLSTETPSEDDLKKIEQIIKKSMGADVSLISKVDATIIGGYILNIGSVMLDGSVRSKLQGLKVSMKGIK